MSEEMTSKERVIKTLNHEIPDRVPISDEVWGSTSNMWHQEGYPWTSWVGREIESGHFGFDFSFFEFNAGPIRKDKTIIYNQVYPISFPSNGKVDEEYKIEGEYLVTSTLYGGRCKIRQDGKAGLLMVDWPVKCKEDWYEIKKYIKPDPDRVDWRWLAREYERACDKQLFKLLQVQWGYDLLQWYMRDEDLLMTMIDDPELIRDMNITQTELALSMLDMYESRGFKFDGAFYYNDMGYRNGMLFSPDTYMKVQYEADKMGFDYFHSKNMKVLLHCDGDVRKLIPTLIDIGLDCLEPLEVKANMDLKSIKEKYGDKLALMGGIDTRIIEEGSDEELENEIKTKFEIGKKGSGYIYHSDHSITEKVSFKRFCFLLDLIKKYGKY
jgi:uroporphyrinogen decarboxylase